LAIPANATAAALPPPIIVLGSRPAATAMVGAMLGCNPAAFAFPQLNLFVGDTLEGVITGTADQGPTHIHGLLRALAYLYGCEQTIISVGMARRWVMRRLAWPTSRIFDELRARVAPRRLIDKSAIYSQDPQCLKRILKTSPNAYFVHVVEHPLTPGATPGSAKRGGGVQGAGGETPQHQMEWLQAQQRISKAMSAAAPEKLAVLRMESLLADPHSEVSTLCERLDLPHDEAGVAEMLHPENSPFAGPGPVGASLGDDPAFLHDPTFPPQSIIGDTASVPAEGEPMLPEVADVASRYGYH
jgi:hypothetical protein